MNLKSVLVMLDPLSLPRLDGIYSFAKKHNWAVILEDRLPENSSLSRLDGAITSLRGRKDQLAKVKALRKLGKPVVDLTVACLKVALPRVTSDHRAIGALAAQHFLERGFENFAWYSSGWSHVHALRYQGFATAVRGRPVCRLANLHAIKLSQRPLAVLAYDEPDAAQVIRECKISNLDVPSDVAVLGIGNDPFLCENGDITISSVDQDLAGAAQAACDLLDSLMSDRSNRRSSDQPSNPTLLIPPAGIIPRASTDTLANPDPTVRAVLLYIHKNLHRTFGTAEVAEKLHVARSTLDHIFAEKTGHPIGKEILRQRLLRAKHLLRDKHAPLKAIAQACGFCNASYFTNTFKRETGLAPKEWRKMTEAHSFGIGYFRSKYPIGATVLPPSRTKAAEL